MTVHIKPLGNRVVIEPIEPDEALVGGFVLPDSAKEKPQQGIILAVGQGLWDDNGKRVPMDVKVGEKVLFTKYAGTEMKFEGKKILILQETDLLGIIE
ncbi:MAG TPA: co-chaperone GroES [Anaerolineales bacterium]|nr:co-chaperone GroES [Anaerolineales bacterium]